MIINSFRPKNSVVAILFFGLPATSQAIGLGDIEIKSHLGQPLRASVSIHSIDSNLEESCFKVLNDNNGISHGLLLKLSPVVNEKATLSILSLRPVDAPILNLALIAECDFSLRRDYVLLLDPLILAEPETTPASGNLESLPELSAASQSVKPQKRTSSNQAGPVRQRSKSGKKKIDQTAVETKQAAVKTEDPLPTGKTSEKTSQQSRLMISNGNMGVETNHLALRMDTDLHMLPAEGVQSLSENDVLDEVTAMNNRLAHLEKQLAALQSRNKQIETEKQSLSIQAIKDKKNAGFQNIVSFIAGMGLLAAGYLVAGWWQRRRQKLLLENEDMFWSSVKAGAGNLGKFEDTIIENMSDNLQQESGDTSETNDDTESIKSDNLQFPSSHHEAITVETEDESENVLDIADAFLTHGRSNLAIQLLQDHLTEFPAESEIAWLFLLDLLYLEGLTNEYERTVAQCKHYYNVEILPHPARLVRDNQASFEVFPHLLAKLQQLWGTPDALNLLDSLIYNDRKQPRNGFNKNVFEELVLLRDIAIEQMQSSKVNELLAERNAKIEHKKQILEFTMEKPIEKEAPQQFEPLPELKIADGTPAKTDDKPSPDEGLEFKL